MAISGCCSSGLVVTAVIALLLIPAQYYVPDPRTGVQEIHSLQTTRQAAYTSEAFAWLDRALVHVPPLELLFTVIFLVLGLVIYFYEWVQRKIMEKRIIKLNRYLGASVERLRAWDVQQEQLEATLKMVQNATSEYNLLLYLLLRQHRCLSGASAPPSNCFFDKTMEEDLNFITSIPVDA